MEFHEKIQELRRRRGITQEELALRLYVSRTAISKWESGRGYPNIESLKALARFYEVTVDELLSSDELLSVAEENQKDTETHFRVRLFGLLDLSMLLLAVLPLFADRAGGSVHEVSLFLLGGVAWYLKAAYWLAVVGSAILGILTLALQRCEWSRWMKWQPRLSLLWHAFAVVYAVGRQVGYGDQTAVTRSVSRL